MSSKKQKGHLAKMLALEKEVRQEFNEQNQRSQELLQRWAQSGGLGSSGGSTQAASVSQQPPSTTYPTFSGAPVATTSYAASSSAASTFQSQQPATQQYESTSRRPAASYPVTNTATAMNWWGGQVPSYESHSTGGEGVTRTGSSGYPSSRVPPPAVPASSISATTVASSSQNQSLLSNISSITGSETHQATHYQYPSAYPQQQHAPVQPDHSQNTTASSFTMSQESSNIRTKHEDSYQRKQHNRISPAPERSEVDQPSSSSYENQLLTWIERGQQQRQVSSATTSQQRPSGGGRKKPIMAPSFQSEDEGEEEQGRVIAQNQQKGRNTKNVNSVQSSDPEASHTPVENIMDPIMNLGEQKPKYGGEDPMTTNSSDMPTMFANNNGSQLQGNKSLPSPSPNPNSDNDDDDDILRVNGKYSSSVEESGSMSKSDENDEFQQIETDQAYHQFHEEIAEKVYPHPLRPGAAVQHPPSQNCESDDHFDSVDGDEVTPVEQVRIPQDLHPFHPDHQHQHLHIQYNLGSSGGGVSQRNKTPSSRSISPIPTPPGVAGSQVSTVTSASLGQHFPQGNSNNNAMPLSAMKKPIPSNGQMKQSVIAEITRAPKGPVVLSPLDEKINPHGEGSKVISPTAGELPVTLKVKRAGSFGVSKIQKEEWTPLSPSRHRQELNSSDHFGPMLQETNPEESGSFGLPPTSSHPLRAATCANLNGSGQLSPKQIAVFGKSRRVVRTLSPTMMDKLIDEDGNETESKKNKRTTNGRCSSGSEDGSHSEDPHYAFYQYSMNQRAEAEMLMMTGDACVGTSSRPLTASTIDEDDTTEKNKSMKDGDATERKKDEGAVHDAWTMANLHAMKDRAAQIGSASYHNKKTQKGSYLQEKSKEKAEKEALRQMKIAADKRETERKMNTSDVGVGEFSLAMSSEDETTHERNRANKDGEDQHKRAGSQQLVSPPVNETPESLDESSDESEVSGDAVVPPVSVPTSNPLSPAHLEDDCQPAQHSGYGIVEPRFPTPNELEETQKPRSRDVNHQYRGVELPSPRTHRPPEPQAFQSPSPHSATHQHPTSPYTMNFFSADELILDESQLEAPTTVEVTQTPTQQKEAQAIRRRTASNGIQGISSVTQQASTQDVITSTDFPVDEQTQREPSPQPKSLTTTATQARLSKSRSNSGASSTSPKPFLVSPQPPPPSVSTKQKQSQKTQVSHQLRVSNVKPHHENSLFQDGPDARNFRLVSEDENPDEEEQGAPAVIPPFTDRDDPMSVMLSSALIDARRIRHEAERKRQEVAEALENFQAAQHAHGAKHQQVNSSGEEHYPKLQHPGNQSSTWTTPNFSSKKDKNASISKTDPFYSTSPSSMAATALRGQNPELPHQIPELPSSDDILDSFGVSLDTVSYRTQTLNLLLQNNSNASHHHPQDSSFADWQSTQLEQEIERNAVGQNPFSEEYEHMQSARGGMQSNVFRRPSPFVVEELMTLRHHQQHREKGGEIATTNSAQDAPFVNLRSEHLATVQQHQFSSQKTSKKKQSSRQDARNEKTGEALQQNVPAEATIPSKEGIFDDVSSEENDNAQENHQKRSATAGLKPSGAASSVSVSTISNHSSSIMHRGRGKQHQDGGKNSRSSAQSTPSNSPPCVERCSRCQEHNDAVMCNHSPKRTFHERDTIQQCPPAEIAAAMYCARNRTSSPKAKELRSRLMPHFHQEYMMFYGGESATTTTNTSKGQQVRKQSSGSKESYGNNRSPKAKKPRSRSSSNKPPQNRVGRVTSPIHNRSQQTRTISVEHPTELLTIDYQRKKAMQWERYHVEANRLKEKQSREGGNRRGATKTSSAIRESSAPRSSVEKQKEASNQHRPAAATTTIKVSLSQEKNLSKEREELHDKRIAPSPSQKGGSSHARLIQRAKEAAEALRREKYTIHHHDDFKIQQGFKKRDERLQRWKSERDEYLKRVEHWKEVTIVSPRESFVVEGHSSMNTTPSRTRLHVQQLVAKSTSESSPKSPILHARVSLFQGEDESVVKEAPPMTATADEKKKEISQENDKIAQQLDVSDVKASAD